jgi:hypothetical protein
MSRWINEDIRNPSRVMWIGCDPSDDETCVNRERGGVHDLLMNFAYRGVEWILLLLLPCF